jgi:hypothetical protein
MVLLNNTEKCQETVLYTRNHSLRAPNAAAEGFKERAGYLSSLLQGRRSSRGLLVPVPSSELVREVSAVIRGIQSESVSGLNRVVLSEPASFKSGDQKSI